MPTRRDFLCSTTAVTTSAALCTVSTGCLEIENPLDGNSSGPVEPASGAAASLSEIPASDTTVHTLSRTSFGISQRDIERADSIGIDTYIEEQLDPETIADAIDAEIALRFPSTQMTSSELAEIRSEGSKLQRENRDATLYRMLYSHRQLQEVMVDFWSNHFNVDGRVEPMKAYKTLEDREVIRSYAMEKFRDLLFASAKSPAMLEYLDNASNTKNGPNENYARELLELHTMGIGGGYSEDDIKEIARCFTGWGVDHESIRFKFYAGNHDEDQKFVLGQSIPAGQGVEDGEQVLDILASHPSTARFIATKLVRRFVADDPPDSLVEKVVESYVQNEGDIRAMLRVILTSEEFLNAADLKMKRPLEYICSAVRALAPDPDNYQGPDIVNTLATLGQLPFEWPSPDGFPDAASYWNSAVGLAARWEFALGLAENTSGTGPSHAEALLGEAKNAREVVDQLGDAILHRALKDEDRAGLIFAITEEGADPEVSLAEDELKEKAAFVTAALLGSPYFMVR